jgi:hypothetical protein
MATRIQLRRDTATNWTTNNPTLAEGEIGYETDTNKFKIGSGSTSWSGLEYFGVEVDLSEYLTIDSASSTYITQISASNTYLTQISASTTYATKEELNNIDLSSASAAAVAAIVDSAPETLDTLNELAAALGDDANFASTITAELGNKLNISTASSTYLTQASASTTYLTQESASTTYATIGSGGGESITKRFIAIGPSDYFYISSNGYDWTTTPAPTLSPVDTWNAVHYANGIYVAAGGNNVSSSKQVIYTSTDAINWTLRHTENTNTLGYRIENIVYGNDIWVAQELQGRAFYSSDNAETWNSMYPGGNITDITYADGNFLIVGYNLAKKSTNGSTWTNITLPVTDVTWNGCSYHNGLYFIFQNNSSVYLTSPDLTTWTQRTHPQPFSNAKVGVSARGILVTAVQNHNVVYGTADGINWKTFTMQLNFPGLTGNGGNPTETGWQNGTYGDGKWIFGSKNSNAVYMSENGQTWFNSVIPGMSIIRSTAYGEF